MFKSDVHSEVDVETDLFVVAEVLLQMRCGLANFDGPGLL